MGAAELVLGDTTGMANPLQVEALLGRLREELPGVKLTPHFHNTRGAGLANVLAALSVGIDSLEASFGELGGCQFARGATGNIATEDLVSMLSEMGIETGIDLPALLVTVAEMEEFLGRRLQSHVSHAGPVDWTGGA
jgi:hydroxymethylglutaryl-CoA lyase